MTRFPPRIAPEVVLWLANLAVVVVAIAAIAWTVERLLRHRSLPARHGILLSAILLTAISPLLLAAATGLGWGFQVPLAWDGALPEETVQAPSRPAVVHQQPAAPRGMIESPAVAEVPARPLTVGDLLEPGEVLQFHSQQTRPAPIDHRATEPVAVTPVVPPEPTSRIRRIDWRPLVSAVGGWCIMVWGVGAIFAGLRLIIGWRQVHRLKQSLQLVEHSSLREKLTQSALAAGLRDVPRLMSSPVVPVPAVCGLWRPIIILPEQFVDESNNPSLDSILLHECAHIRRCDLWVGWLQRIVGAAFWWNIPLYGVQRRLNDLREDLCDNHVLAQHPDGRSYARVLLDLVSRASGSRPIPVSVGLVEGPSSGLSARITRLLREDRNMATNLNRRSTAVLIAFACLIAVAICGLSLRTESAVADDASAGASQTTNPDTQQAADQATDEEPPADQPPAVPQLTEQTEILSPLFYDDQMLALVNAEGAAAVRFERQDNGIVRYEWRYLSAEDGVLDPKASLDPNPHELRGEGTLEPIMMGPMPIIDAGPIDLLWFPSTELQGWVSFNPAMLEVLPLKRSLFAVEKGPFDSYAEALDLNSLFVSDDVPGDETVGQLPPPIQHVTSRLVYDAMVLVVSHPDGVAAFEFNDPFREGDMQTQSREGVRYRCYYRDNNGFDEVVGFNEVYEVYKDGQYNQGQLTSEAGPVRVEWSNGGAEVGWIYYDPRDVHCWLVSRDYFEQFLPAGSSETDRRFDLGRFRHGQRPLTPPVDPSAVADTGTQLAVVDDDDPEQQRRQRIADAIERGVEFLTEEQQDNGTWGLAQLVVHDVGIQSLAVLSLLEADRPVDDPSVARALDWLRDQDDPNHTYDIALMIIALAAAGDEADQPRITRLAATLEGLQVDGIGAWGYDFRSGNWWDNSNSQYAVYGLYAAHRAEVDVGLEVVRHAIDHYVEQQVGDVESEDGAGWNYRGELSGGASGNMTASAIASLIMLSEILEDQPELSEEDTARLTTASKAIESGQRWLERHFTVRTNPGDNSWVLCYLLNLRHAAEMAELTMIGEHDWYREGADYLVQEQNRNNGSWTSPSELDPVVPTSMALLFLAAEIDEQEATAVLSPVGPPVTEVSQVSPPSGPSAVESDPFSLQQTPTEPTNSGFPVADPMTSGPFDPLTPTVPSNPPLAVDAPPGSRTFVLIHLTAADDGSLGDLRFFNDSLGSGAAAIEALPARLDQWKSELATRRQLFELTAQITADESLLYGELLGVIDACQKAEIKNLSLSTGFEGDAIDASVGYLRDAAGRKISDDPILNLPGATESVEEAVGLFEKLSETLASEVHEHGEPLLPQDLVFHLNVDHEVPSDVVQQIIQNAANAGFAKFTLETLGGDGQPMNPSTSVTPDNPPVAETNIAGTVIAMDDAHQLVTLSIGIDDGIKLGQRLSIVRRSETNDSNASLILVGVCEVTQLLPDQCVARIISIPDDPELSPQHGDQIVGVPRSEVDATEADNLPTAETESELREQIFAALGLELEPVQPTDDRLDGTAFHGGLEVVEVLSGGPAAGEGIEPGDILVGLHQWETISLDNVGYVITHRDVAQLGLLKFYVVRDGYTRYGFIEPTVVRIVDVGFGGATELTVGTLEAEEIAYPLRAVVGSTADVSFEAVTVNLNEGRLNRFLNVALILQVPQDRELDVQALLEERRTELRSWLLGYLSELTTDAIRGEAGQERIRRRIKSRFNAMLYPDGENVITNVLFEQFNVQ